MGGELQLVVLDMAGTTVQDKGEVPRAFVETLAAHGIALTAEQVNAVRGANKREAIARLLASENQQTAAEAVYAQFRERLAAIYSTSAEAIPGAEATMRELRRRGVRIALNTGFDREITTLLLRALNWQNIADTVVCADDVRRGRPAPDMILRAMELTSVRDNLHVMNVGDTVLDLQAGNAAGVAWNVGLLTGAHSRDQMEHAPYTHILNSISDIPRLMHRVECGSD